MRGPSLAAIVVAAIVGLASGCDDDQTSAKAAAPPSSAEVRAECRATASDYEGNSLGARLIACHRALGRPFPTCKVTPRNPYPSGLVLPGSGNTGPTLAYKRGEPPCVLER
jgi:hypothetical protein